MHFVPVRLISLTLCSLVWLSAANRPSSLTLPVWFEPSATGEVFHARGAAGSLSIDSRGVWMQVRGVETDSLVRLRFLGAKPTLLEGERRLAGKSQHFRGNDRSKWRKDVPHFQQVRARNAYPGVDVVYYPAGRSLEYDFVVAPGADPSVIALRLEGGAGPVLTENGSLRIIAGGTELLQHKPFAYQRGPAGEKSEIAASYVLADDGQIRLSLGAYDRQRELIIDPVLSYSGYFGGGAIELVEGAAASPDGGFWIVGTASSEIAPPEGAAVYQSTLKGNTDAFIAKVKAEADNTWRVEHFSYLGGDDSEEGLAITVDAQGIVYFTGWTQSINFPLGGNAFQTTRATDGDRDAFVAKYDPTGDGPFNLVYSSYFGAASREQGQAIAVNRNGFVAIGGATLSGTLPEAPGRGFYQPSNRGGTDGFVAVFNPAAVPASNTLVMSTFFGGNGSDTIDTLAFNSSGQLVAGGYTSSSDLPLAGNVFQPNLSGGSDGYLAIFDLEKSGFDQLLYGGYFGGAGIDRLTALDVDAEDKVWVTGYTQSSSFPTSPNGWMTQPIGSTDVFVARLDPGKTGNDFLLYSTLYGGARTDVAYALRVLSPTRVVIAGYTTSGDLPFFGVTGGPGQPPPALTEMFAAAFDTSQPATGSLTWSLSFGGAKTDVATGIAVNPAGDVFVAGYTDSYGLNGLGEDVPGKMNGVGQPTGFFFAIRP